MVKISRPVPRGAYIRRRLFARLDELRQTPVTWVSAPAGAGKTTLVGSYIEQGKIPCLWYQLDAGDSDLATFFYYMGQAGLKAAPRKKKSLPLLTPEYLPGINTFTRRYFEELFLRLPRPSLIVFDNYQDVPSDAPLHAVMLNALSILPEGINAVVISRSDPPPAFIRLKAGRMMEVLGWEEVRLMEEESGAIIRMRVAGETSAETIRELHKMSGGWAAGLSLMTETMERKGLLPEDLGEFTQAEIFAYYAQEVFGGLDARVRTFMLKTAFLPKMTAAMAGALTGEAKADMLLADMYQRNYFLVERFDPTPVYEYHPLYREFLMARAGQDLAPEELTMVRRSAAALLEKSGQSEEAVALLRDIADWEGMAGIILAHAPQMLAQGRHHALEYWLLGVPESVRQASPLLLFWLGMSRQPFDPPCSMGDFEAAGRLFEAHNDAGGIMLAWMGMATVVTFGYDGWEKVDALIKFFEDHMDLYDALPSDELRAMAAGGMFGILACRRPEHPQAGLWADLALELNRAIGDREAVNRIMNWRVQYCLGAGQLRQAAREIDALQRFEHDPHVSELGRGHLKFAQTAFYNITCQHEQCLRAADTDLALARSSGIHMWDNLIITHAAFSCMNVGDSSGAAHYIELLDASAHEPRLWMQSFTDLMHTRYALLRGDRAGAARHAEYGMRGIDTGPTIGLDCSKRIFYARVRRALDQTHAAHELLSQAAAMIAGLNNPHLQIDLAWLEAETAFDEDRADDGLAILRQVLPMAREIGYYLTFFDLPATTAALCAHALQAGIETDYAREIIRRRQLTPPPAIDAALALDAWPYPIKIYTLGSFEIVKDDEPLVFAGKVQKKPLEMLKAVIAMGGAHVPVERLTDALWPEAEGDLAYKSFETTLARLRRLLGGDEIITYRAGELGLDPLCCRVDSLVLGSLVEAVAKVCADEAVGLCEKAMRLYKGPFLPADAGLAWSVPRREMLHNRMLRIIMTAGQHYESAGQWEQALDCYTQGLATDPLAEAFYQRRMVCCGELGHHAEAVQTYHACRRLLQDHLGINPSAATEAIHSAILKKR